MTSPVPTPSRPAATSHDPIPVRCEPGMTSIRLPADAPFAPGDKVMIEVGNSERIPGVVAAGSIVELECMTGPGAWRARVRHRRQDAL